MDTRSNYLVQLLEKLGSPLLSAVSEIDIKNQMSGHGGESPSPKDSAQRMAELLGKSTQLSVEMGKTMELDKMDADTADSVRVALAALSGPMVANLYRQNGRIPGDAELEKLSASLQTVMSYSDNFSAAADSAKRLEMIDRDFIPGDDHQIYIQYLQILMPAVNSVLAFPFGQSEKKMVQVVADTLIARSREIRARVFPDLEGAEAARSDLALLRAAVSVYSQCHFAEMAKIMSRQNPEEGPPELSTDPIWEAFNQRMAMLEVLASHIIPGGDTDAQAGQKSGDAQAPAQEQQQAQQPQKQTEAPAQPSPVQQAAQTDQSQPVQPPTQEQTPQPPQQQQEQAQQQQEQQPAAPGTQDGGSGEDDSQQQEGFNPMAFFSKKQPDEGDDKQQGG